MLDQIYYKDLKRRNNANGWALCIYYLVMNVAVMVAMFFEVIIKLLPLSLYGNNPTDAQIDHILLEASQNGWGYFLAMAFGFILLLMWKKKEFTFKTIWHRGKPMTVGAFIVLLCILVSCQLTFQLLTMLLESILNALGLSAEQSVESATSVSTTFSMFLYAYVGAPIAEEILFRGAVLRSVQPYGKRYAIFTSAFLFGIFHGNITQSPFAFAVGLILGYVAVEYSMLWAMVLHMVNNMGLNFMLSKLTEGLTYEQAMMTQFGIIIGLSLAAYILLIVNHKKIGDYRKENPMPKGGMKAFFSAPGVIVLTILMIVNMLVMLFLENGGM